MKTVIALITIALLFSGCGDSDNKSENEGESINSIGYYAGETEFSGLQISGNFIIQDITEENNESLYLVIQRFDDSYSELDKEGLTVKGDYGVSADGNKLTISFTDGKEKDYVYFMDSDYNNCKIVLSEDIEYKMCKIN